LQAVVGFFDDLDARRGLFRRGKFSGKGGDRLKAFEPAGANRRVAPCLDIGEQNIEGVRLEGGNFDFPADNFLLRPSFERRGLEA